MKYITILALFFSNSLLFSQDFVKSINLFSSYSIDNHDAQFKEFSGLADCGLFDGANATGFDYAAGITFDFNGLPYLGIDFSYMQRTGTFENNTFFYGRNFANNQVTEVITKNYIDFSYSALMFSPNVQFTVFKNVINGPLLFKIGTDIILPIQSEFDQYERIQSPSFAVFEDNGKLVRQRSVAKGEFKSINSMQLALNTNLTNHAKISSNLYITQSIGFRLPLSRFLSDVDWQISGLQLSLGLAYFFDKEVIEPKIEEKIITKPKRPIELAKNKQVDLEVTDYFYKLEVDLSINQDYKIQEISEIKASLPLVESIFFDSLSADIPNKYLSTKGNIDYFNSNPVELHFATFYTITEKLKANPSAKLEIVAYTSNYEAVYAESSTLAKQRLDAVIEHLTFMGVDKSRVSSKLSQMPQLERSLNIIGIDQEYRKVDFKLSGIDNQEFVSFTRLKEIPLVLDYDAKFNNEENCVLSSIIFAEDVILEESGKGRIELKHRILGNSDKLEAEFALYGVNGEDNKMLTLDIPDNSEKSTEFDFSNFEAILRFDYNSSNLRDDVKGLLTQLATKLPQNAEIIIEGSADGSDTQKRNIELIEQRANNTKGFLKSKLNNKKVNFILGKNEGKFDESTPQGRILNRSIRLRIK